ncbi:MAG TPA: ABC transporter permease [Candidatus Acidoferrales bacterium]|nr:ABC transporter permease [Candidatus Acidoferrales bacterium]
MTTLTEWRNRIRYLFRSRRIDAELAEEIRLHREVRISELVAGGLPLREATAQAACEFGSVALAQEDSRAPWKFRWLEDFATDIRHGLRSFLRTPVFSLTAILSIALGIGGASAMYAALDAVLWKPLPVRDPGRLVSFAMLRDGGGKRNGIPLPFAAELSRSNLLTGLTIDTADGLSLTYDGRAERVVGEVTSPNYFELLGVKMFLGQGFTPDLRSGHWAPEAVLSYGYWMRRFGGDPSVLGRSIHLNTYPFTIVGVTGPEFTGLERGTNYELRIPILPSGQSIPQVNEVSGTQDWLGAVARLAPGVTVAQAKAAWSAQYRHFLQTAADSRLGRIGFRNFDVLPAGRGFVRWVEPLSTSLYVLLILASAVLAVACFNVANMFLARGTAREREFAIRTSIGAGRWRLMRQMVAEATLISVIGGALGVSFANAIAAALIQFLPQGHIALDIQLHPDWRVFAAAFAISVSAGMVFGLISAVKCARRSIAGVLKSEGGGAIGGDRGARIRKILVGAQVAVALALLIAAAVFVRTESELRPADFRSDPARVLLFTMKPPQELYSDERKERLANELIRRMSALPGVESAALAEDGPFASRTDVASLEQPGKSPVYVGDDTVSPGLFGTAGIPFISGRDFDARDTENANLVVIINQAFADSYFPGQNPIGHKLKFPTGVRDEMYEIIGVVANVHYDDLHKPPAPFVWFSLGQNAPYMPTLHVRMRTADAAGVGDEIRREFDAIDTGFPIFNVRTMADRIEDALAGERMLARLSGAFGLLALVLAAVGLYGVLAYSVTRRTREIGIRIALGARQATVMLMITREVFFLVGLGCMAGIVAAVAGLRATSHYLAGLAAIHFQIVALCTGGMFFIAAIAAAVPALRGSRVDPLIALRQD